MASVDPKQATQGTSSAGKVSAPKSSGKMHSTGHVKLGTTKHAPGGGTSVNHALNGGSGMAKSISKAVNGN